VRRGKLSNQDHLRKLISYHTQRLQKLKEQQALSGITTDPKVLIEIEQIETQLVELQSQLFELKNTPGFEAQPQGNEEIAPATISVYIRNQDLSIQHFIPISPVISGWQFAAQVYAALQLKESISAPGGLIGLRFKYQLLFNNMPLPEQLSLAEAGVTDNSIIDLQVLVEQFTAKKTSISVEYRPAGEAEEMSPQMVRRLMEKAFGHLIEKRSKK
jgi:hypothetical protein